MFNLPFTWTDGTLSVARVFFWDGGDRLTEVDFDLLQGTVITFSRFNYWLKMLTLHFFLGWDLSSPSRGSSCFHQEGQINNLLWIKQCFNNGLFEMVKLRYFYKSLQNWDQNTILEIIISFERQTVTDAVGSHLLLNSLFLIFLYFHNLHYYWRVIIWAPFFLSQPFFPDLPIVLHICLFTTQIYL